MVRSKFERFFAKRRLGRKQLVKPRVERRKQVTSVKFDMVSKMHLHSRLCIVSSYKAAGRQLPRIVYSSLPKVMSKVYTKRSVIGKVQKKMGIAEH